MPNSRAAAPTRHWLGVCSISPREQKKRGIAGQRRQIPLEASKFRRPSSPRRRVIELSLAQRQLVEIARALAAEVEASGWRERGIRLIFESFNLDVLTRARAILGEIGQYVFLVDRDHLPGQTRYVSDEFLAALVGKVHGVSFDIDLVLGQKPAFSSADFGSPTGLVERAHALGFTVYTWTARVEQALY